MEVIMNAQHSTQNAHVEIAELISIGAYKLINAIETAFKAISR